MHDGSRVMIGQLTVKGVESCGRNPVSVSGHRGVFVTSFLYIPARRYCEAWVCSARSGCVFIVFKHELSRSASRLYLLRLKSEDDSDQTLWTHMVEVKKPLNHVYMLF